MSSTSFRQGYPPRRVFLIALIVCAVFLLVGCSGNPLRFAPSEEQRQAAMATHLVARAVDEAGAEAKSPATGQLVEGTAASLAYIGAPAELDTQDIEAATAQARADATRRPGVGDVIDAADAGLELAIAVAGVLGIGGLAAGKKALDYMQQARDKAGQLREVVAGNELAKRADPAVAEAIKRAQGAVQSHETERVVAVERKDPAVARLIAQAGDSK